MVMTLIISSKSEYQNLGWQVYESELQFQSYPPLFPFREICQHRDCLESKPIMNLKAIERHNGKVFEKFVKDHQTVIKVLHRKNICYDTAKNK